MSLSLLSSSLSSPGSSSLEVLSFCVQTLYSKSRGEWNQLSLADRHALQLQLLSFLRQHCSANAPQASILQRLADTVAILAVRSGKNGCRHLMEALITGPGGLQQQQRASTSSSASCEERYCTLLVLSALADEVRRVKVSWSRGQQLCEELHDGVQAVFLLVLDTTNNPAFSPSAPTPSRLPVMVQALELLVSYLWPHFVSSERTLELLSHTGLLSNLLTLLHSLLYTTPTPQQLIELLVDVLSYALEAELERLDDEQITAMQAHMQPVYDLLVALIPLFHHCHTLCGAAYIPPLPTSPLSPNPSSSSSSYPPPPSVAAASFLSHRFAALLDTLLRADIAAVSSGRGPHSLPLIHTLLAFTSYPFTHRNTMHHTVQFWTQLQARPLKERHKHLRQPVFTTLVDVLLTITRYPPTFTRWDDRGGVGFAGQRDEWEAFCGEAGDVMGDAFPLLKEEFCAVCARQLGGPGGGEWVVVTAVVEGLRCIADPFQAMVWEGKSTKGITEALVPLLQRLLHSSSLPSHPALTSSTCHLLYTLHFWLCEQPQLLHPAVSYLLHAASTASQAGKAFSRLMGKAGAALAEEVGTVEAVMTAVLGEWGGWKEGVRREFCAGLGMLLEHVKPTERAAGYLHQLMSPVVAAMSGALQGREEGKVGVGAAAAVVVEGVRLVCGVLWSDSRQADAVGEALPSQALAWQAVRLSMLEGLMDTLDKAEAAQWEEEQEEEVKGALCSLHLDVIRMIQHSPYTTTWIPPIIHRTARLFTSRPLPAALTVLEATIPCLKAKPALFPQLLAVLPAVVESAVKRVADNPVGQAELFGGLCHLLSLLVQQAGGQLQAEVYALFPPLLRLTPVVLLRVDDGYSQAVSAQLHVELLFSINANVDQRSRVDARPTAAEDGSDERRTKREAWTALWREHLEPAALTFLTLLLARPYGDTQASAPDSTSPSSPSPAASDDDDEPSPSPSAKAERSGLHTMFRPKAVSFLFHSALAFGEVGWRCVEGEVRRACEKAGWRGADAERVVGELRRWLLDGEQRRWSELFEDVRRLMHQEDTLDALLAYDVMWEERRRREEERLRRQQGAGSSHLQAIQLS